MSDLIYSKALGAVLHGLKAHAISVECSFLKGLPGFQVVGLAKGAVYEAKERVKAALLSIGIQLPPKRIIVNLSPVDLHKEGGTLDLPIAISILRAMGFANGREDLLALGELGLDGKVKSSRGIFSAVISLYRDGYRNFLVPPEEAQLLSFLDANIWSISHLSDVVRVLNGEVPPVERRNPLEELTGGDEISGSLLWQVKGNKYQKWALTVAAAGHHNVLMIGPPGTGKSMMAKAMSDLLPPLGFEEYLEVESIYSLTGERYASLKRPVRSPHHTSSYASIIGGGKNATPGEISLAHRGVLILDEFPEFRRDVIEALRSPLEDGEVTISRAEVKVTFPAKFILVATMNPCPCGYLGTPRCRCTPNEVKRYWRKISGPILDRFDIVVEVPRIPWEELLSTSNASQIEHYRSLKDKVRLAWKRQKLQGKPNSDLSPSDIDNLRARGRIPQKSIEVLEESYLKGASIRRLHRTLRVAKTIADLYSDDVVREEYILEALALYTDYRELI